MHQGALIDDAELDVAKAFARELEDGQAVDSVFVVRERVRREKRNGDQFLKLRLSDVTGTVDGVVWDDVDAFVDASAPGTVVRVEGRFAVDSRYGGCITIRHVTRDHPIGHPIGRSGIDFITIPIMPMPAIPAVIVPAPRITERMMDPNT